MDAVQRNIQPIKSIFQEKVNHWSDNASASEFLDWEEQIKLLSEIGDSITPDLSLEELIAEIYASVNQIMDAYQFAVGLYDEKEGIILFKGLEVVEGSSERIESSHSVFDSHHIIILSRGINVLS